MLACPACGKKSAITPAPCGRCGCDLSRLTGIVRAAGRHLKTGTTALRSGESAAALEHARASWQLLHSREAVSLGALAATALRDPAELRLWQIRSR